MLLSEVRLTATDSALHIRGNESFSSEKIDRAARDCLNYYLREVPASTTTTPVSLPSGSRTLDMTEWIAQFIVADYISGKISDDDVALTDYEMCRRRYQSSTPKGQPAMIGFRDNRDGLFDKQLDANYTFMVTHRRRFVEIDLGSPEDIEINIPDNIAGDLVRWGVRGYLLYGAPGHPDSGPAMKRFEDIVASAKKEFRDMEPESRFRFLPALAYRQLTTTRRTRK
jgi:hypothetical protein